MPETIFHKIVAGELPCHKVYEDDQVLAFLDVFPLSKGHTLVIPKVHVETIDELDDEHAAAIGRVLPRIARAVKKVSGAEAYNILQNNGALAHQAVMWLHFHIIPKFEDGNGLGVDWPAKELGEGGAELAAAIAAEI